MLKHNKTIILLMTALFAVQSCSRAITPTAGITGLDTDSPETEIAGAITEYYCLLGDDQDANGDGQCDLEEAAAAEDCTSADGCPAEQSRAPWIIRVGLPALGVLGTLTMGAEWLATGNLWFNKEVDGEGLFRVTKDEANNFSVNATEEWELVGGISHSKIRIEATALRGYDFTEMGVDEKMKQGDQLIYCANGALGTDVPVTASETGYPGQYEINATWTYGNVYYTNFVAENQNVNGRNMTLAEFNARCDAGGIWLAMENKDGFFVTAVDTSLLTGHKANDLGQVDIAYLIDALPSTDITTGHTFNVARKHRTIDELRTYHFNVNLNSAQVAIYNNPEVDTPLERAKAVFGQYVGEGKVTATADETEKTATETALAADMDSSSYWGY